MPNGAIIEIVRPNWDLRKEIGTALNISHLGFAIWINDKLYFRQASSQYGKVIDVPLIDYLDKARSSPTIKGINIQVVLPTKPTSNGCKLF
nr:N-acetylmuramoyl-L-alanine amidase-like domain-containing protein [Legionella norrlandica]